METPKSSDSILGFESELSRDLDAEGIVAAARRTSFMPEGEPTGYDYRMSANFTINMLDHSDEIGKMGLDTDVAPIWNSNGYNFTDADGSDFVYPSIRRLQIYDELFVHSTLLASYGFAGGKDSNVKKIVAPPGNIWTKAAIGLQEIDMLESPDFFNGSWILGYLVQGRETLEKKDALRYVDRKDVHVGHFLLRTS